MNWSIRGSHLASIYGLVYSPALRVSRHTRLISAAEVAEGPQLYRVPCTLPSYYTILHYPGACQTGGRTTTTRETEQTKTQTPAEPASPSAAAAPPQCRMGSTATSHGPTRGCPSGCRTVVCDSQLSPPGRTRRRLGRCPSVRALSPCPGWLPFGCALVLEAAQLAHDITTDAELQVGAFLQTPKAKATSTTTRHICHRVGSGRCGKRASATGGAVARPCELPIRETTPRQ